MLIGIAALVIQMIYFLLDDRAANNNPLDLNLKKYWHWAGGALHIWLGYAISRIYNDWHWGLLMASLTWYFFDGMVNSFVLKKEWWYIGTTAWIDKFQQQVAKAIHIEPRLFSALLKHVLLIFSILYVTKIL